MYVALSGAGVPDRWSMTGAISVAVAACRSQPVIASVPLTVLVRVYVRASIYTGAHRRRQMHGKSQPCNPPALSSLSYPKAARDRLFAADEDRLRDSAGQEVSSATLTFRWRAPPIRRHWGSTVEIERWVEVVSTLELLDGFRIEN